MSPAELRRLATEIENDHRYGVVARLITCAILRGIASRTERESTT